MKAFMTNGTIDFLLKLEEKYPDINFSFMSNHNGGVAYYENEEKNVFSSGRTYDVLAYGGDIQPEGYVVMNNIPVADESKPVFEDSFKKQERHLESMPGFQAFRLLRPQKGNTYIVLTQWRSEQDFEHWKNSEEFQEAHKKESIKPPAYVAERPFVSAFLMVTEEDKE